MSFNFYIYVYGTHLALSYLLQQDFSSFVNNADFIEMMRLCRKKKEFGRELSQAHFSSLVVSMKQGKITQAHMCVTCTLPKWFSKDNELKVHWPE